ncbi:MAG TPA: glycosyltransferase N-terminal domain-containing protein [Bacteroidia bacterium]|nr:glycosyltransferase N-terminal domain-containing protein [Bacteroidia bacterium]
MVVFYYLIVKLYGLLILISSPFNKKAAKWVAGRRSWKKVIKETLRPGEKRIHFHCASLGEFEQGRPVLESLRQNYNTHKIVLTFFSPSGYEMKKNDPLADYVFYLPLDGPFNSKSFIEIVNPEMSFFVKYEFWHFYIKGFKDHKIPVYFVSCIFRPSQIFFQKWGSFFEKILRRVTHFFVQNQESLELLYKQGIPQVTVTGDTRFDRVYFNSQNSQNLPEIASFKGSKKLFVAGSTWGADEKILVSLLKEITDDFKIIFVPHEISESKIKKLQDKLNNKAIRYSEWDKKSFNSDILIIDNVGMLISIYKYADVAYVGGGFGSGIHNILEAAVFGVPVFFGPKYKKFREAVELVHWKGAFSVKNEKELIDKFTEITFDPTRLEKIKEINLRYINNHRGATDLIINYLKLN